MFQMGGMAVLVPQPIWAMYITQAHDHHNRSTWSRQAQHRAKMLTLLYATTATLHQPGQHIEGQTTTLTTWGGRPGKNRGHRGTQDP